MKAKLVITLTEDDNKLIVAANNGMGLFSTIANRFDQAALHILNRFQEENLKVSVKLPDVVNVSGTSPRFPRFFFFALINNWHGKTSSSEWILAFCFTDSGSI